VSAHLVWLAIAVADAGDFKRARALAEESDALGRASGDTWRRLVPIVQLGWLGFAENDLAEAEWRFRTAVDLATGWGGLYVAQGLFGLCQVRLRRGEPEDARALCRRALLGLQETSSGNVYHVEGLAHTASVDAWVGLHARAQRLMGAYDAWHARGGAERMWHPSWSVFARSLVPLPPTPTDPSLARARAEGRAMSLDEAVAWALEPIEVARQANE
jgi:hypothetical protein